ncbi:MAG: hypothetical protein WC127_03470 [Acidaminococcaceae bacterium]
MNAKDYISKIKKRLSPFFDFKNPDNEKNYLPLQLLGELNETSERYLLVRKFNIYTINNDEYLFVQSFNDPITQNILDAYTTWVETKMQALKPRKNHMTSSYLLVLVSEYPISDEQKKYISMYKYHKDYLLTLKGWSDLALIVVDLSNNKLLTNKFGAKTAKNFEM